MSAQEKRDGEYSLGGGGGSEVRRMARVGVLGWLEMKGGRLKT